MGGINVSHSLILGLELNLEKIVVETNQEYRGQQDKKNPSLIMSNLTIEEYNSMDSQDRFKSVPGHYLGYKRIMIGHLLPKGTIAEVLIDNNTFLSTSGYSSKPKLTFIAEDESEAEQLLGLIVMSANTFSEAAFFLADERKLLKGLKRKNDIAKMINQYGFDCKTRDIRLYHYIYRTD